MTSEPTSSSGRRTVLRDPDRDDELSRRGVTAVPFLDPDEVDRISDAYWQHAKATDAGLTIDYMRPEREIVRALAAVLEPVLAPHIEEVLVDHKIVLATFVVKHPGEDSAMFLHDDRSYVDERKFRAATLWIPLVDVGPDLPNGGLQVVPGSHRLPTGWSGSNTPDVIRPWEAALREGLEPVTASAGTAVVYDTRVLHASGPNLSSRPRIAVACAVAPAEAQLFHVRAVGRRTRHLHSVDDDFFLDHHPREIEQRMPDDCPVVETFPDDPELDAGTIRDLLGLDVGAGASVPVPSDLAGDVSPRRSSRLLELARPGQPPSDRDLALDVDVLGRASPPVATIEVHDIRGEVAVVPLTRRFRRVRHVPPELRGRPGPSSRVVRDSDLLVLEPGARARVRAATTPRWRTELAVLECPVVGSGVGDPDGSLGFGLGTDVVVPQGVDLTVWNDGPGQLVVIASRAPAEAGLLGRALARFARAA